MKYYKMSSDQGDMVAEASLGYCYENGLGVEVDMMETERYYQLANDPERCC